MTTSPIILTMIADPELQTIVDEATAGLTVQAMPAFSDDRAAVAFVADRRASLLLIELPDTPLRWLGTVRSDPATRRVPLIALASSPKAEAMARHYFADAVINWHELVEPLRDILIHHARSAPDAAVLSDQCEQMPPPLVLRGLREFNAGEYFECHETLEEAWLHEQGTVRELYRAILQVGIAYYQITRNNYRGAHKMFLRAVQWITPLPDRCQGIDVAKLRRDAAVARTQLEALGEARIAEFDRSLLKSISYEGANDGREQPE
ncbi:MAG: DUF309 domain-containing protein [Anaerolineae bacterium]